MVQQIVEGEYVELFLKQVGTQGAHPFEVLDGIFQYVWAYCDEPVFCGW